MQKAITKIAKIGFNIVAAVIIALAVMLSTARIILPHLTHYHAKFDQWASDILHQPVTTDTMEVGWSGLSPVVTFNGITIFNDAKTIKLLQVKNMEIRLNIYSSLINWRPVFDTVQVEGADIIIHQLADGEEQVQGISSNFQQKNKPSDINDVLHWLFNQGKISLKEFNIILFKPDGTQINITNLAAQLTNEGDKHLFAGVARFGKNLSGEFQFIIKARGNIAKLNTLKVTLYVYIKDMYLRAWLSNRSWHGLSLNKGHIKHLQIWGHLQSGKLQDLQALIISQNLNLISDTTQASYVVHKLAGNLFWQRQANGWRVSGNQIQFDTPTAVWPQNEFNLQVTHSPLADNSQNLFIHYLNISDLSQLLNFLQLMPLNMAKIIQKLQPQGNFYNIQVTHQGDHFNSDNTRISAGFEKLKLNAWKQMPAIDNLSGRFNVGVTAGELLLKGKDVTVWPKSLFNQALPINHYQLLANWQKLPMGWKFNLPSLLLNLPILSIQTQLTLKTDADFKNAVINLAGEFNAHDIQKLKAYIPVKMSHPKLKNWLESAFIKGDSAEGVFQLQGPLNKFPFDDNSGLFSLNMHVKNLTLNYKSGWPLMTNLDANLDFMNRALLITSYNGKIFNSQLNGVRAYFKDLKDPVLLVQGDLSGDLKDGLSFIQQSPLKDKIGADIEGINLQGPMHLTLDLTVPLNKDQQESTEVNGNITFLKKSQLSLPAWHLQLAQLEGDLNFTNNDLNADNLTAQLLNNPVSLQINFSPVDSLTTINLKGAVAIKDLQQYYETPLWKYAKGNTQYVANIKVFNKEPKRQISVTVNSDLKGVTVNLPEPLQKIDANGAAIFSIQANLEKDLNIDLKYNNLTGQLNFNPSDKSWRFFNGVININQTELVHSKMPGLIVNANLDHLNWESIKPYMDGLNTQTTVKADHSWLKEINLNINKLSLFQLLIKQAKITLLPRPRDWFIKITSPTIIGNILIPAGEAKNPWLFNFKRLYLSSDNAEHQDNTIKPSQLPPLNLSCNDFIFNDLKLGQIQLITHPREEGLSISRLQILLANNSINASGLWRETKEGQESLLTGNLQTANLGQLLAFWDITQSMGGGAGNVTFTFSWKGAAYKPQLKILNGNLMLDLKKGRILHVGSSAQAEIGLGRVLNLLSLQSIPRRLSLNFSDLVQSGFSYDTLNGNILLKSGNAYLRKFYLDGPVAKVSVAGRLGLVSKDYDMNLLITPYITSSLPVVATIAGGPIAGVVTWVADKVLNKAVNKISTISYRVTGSWERPNILKLPEP